MAPPSRTFKHLLLWLFAGTRGGSNRGRIIEALREQPMNANQLKNLLNLDYRTVKHHLDILENNNLIVSIGANYGKMYFISSKLEENIEEYDEVWSGIRKRMNMEENEQ